MHAEELGLEIRSEHTVHEHALRKARPRLLPIERQPLRDPERGAPRCVHARRAQLAVTVLHRQFLALQNSGEPRTERTREREVRVRGAIERLQLEVTRGGHRCVAQPHGRLAVVSAPADVRAAGPDAVEDTRIRRRRGEQEECNVWEVLQ